MMRKKLIAFHVLLASFFAPIALMFLLTGALYTVQLKGTYKISTREVVVEQPVADELSAFVALVEKELGSTPAPSGSVSLKGSGSSAELNWGGANREVLLTATSNPLVYEMTVRDTTIHRRMVNLHKAKGSTFSKGISILWSVGLFGMFASGFAMAWSVEKYRKLAAIATVSGLLTFLIYVYIA
ncbi:MAG: hypothetical protein ACFCU1_03290 [Sumerlaeia bacterium]